MASNTNEMNRRSELAANRGDLGEPEVIRLQIEETRAQMGETIERLQERLSPERIRQQTQDTIREATLGKVEEMTYKAEREVKSWPSKIASTVKENPVPAALIGIGLGWLMVSGNDNDYDGNGRYYGQTAEEYRYYPGSRRYRRGPYTGDVSTRINYQNRDWTEEENEGMRDRMHNAADTVQNQAASAAQSVQDRVDEARTAAGQHASEWRDQMSETAEEAQYRAQQMADEWETRARQGVRHTKRTVIETMNENPLAVGAAALAVGALVGLALPGTDPEDRWMGEQRDHLLDEAKEKAQETVHKVQSVAQEATDAAVGAAKQEAKAQDLRTPSPSTSTSTSTSTSSTTTSSTTTPRNTPKT